MQNHQEPNQQIIHQQSKVATPQLAPQHPQQQVIPDQPQQQVPQQRNFHQ